MKVFRFLATALVTIVLIYLLDNSWVISVNGKNIPLPPLGKFLSPYEGFWQNMEPNDELLARTPLNIPGLKDSVSIFYDSLAIPHVFAQNDEDLYLAQGYITAMHRLWQMEFQTHAAAGRISEIVVSDNDRILAFDRTQRRLGMVFGAKHALEAMEKDPISKMVVDQYTKGINAYINALTDATLPFEYKFLAYKPEPWTNLKCALLLKQMAQTLNMSDKDIEMTNALKLLGKETLEILYPDLEPVGDPIVDNTGGWKFDPVKVDSIPLALPDEYIKIDKMPGADPNNGSNNWAVSGSKTATGAPILCGDPHLDLSLPSIWYAIQLHAPGVNVMGASLPGAPGVIIGFNDSIAWSVTNAQRDLVDWYKITYQDNTKSKYLLDGKYVDTKKVVEEFKIKNKPSFYDTVTYTHWGPIAYDESFRAERQNLNEYAFRWIAHDASDEVVAFYKLNRGRSHADYLEALNHFGLPAQNFVFASVSGDIAMRIQGKYPVRRKNEGRFVLDGSKSTNGWNAFIPNEQNVQYKNPVRGFVSSANQYPVDATYPYYVTGKSFEAYRNRRINKLLTDFNNVTVEDMMKMQSDNFNLKASEALPLMLKLLDTLNLNEAEQTAWKTLKQWNYYNDKFSPAAPYFEAWWEEFMPALWDEMHKSDISLQRPSSFVTIKLLQEKPDFIFFDFQGTPEKENAQDIIRMSFALGVKEVEKWKTDHPGIDLKWGLYKDSYMRHLLRAVEPLNIHVNAGGNSGIINAHSRTNGPSWRMVVSLEKSGVKAWGVYPGGQSGNPGSKHYSDMIDFWTEGKHFSLQFLQQPDLNLPVLKLNPSEK